MIRGYSILLAVSLFVLWIVGLNYHTTAWLTWLDGLAAVCAAVIAAAANAERRPATESGALIALALGLFVLWIVGVATHAAVWLTWWTFAFACITLLISFTRGFSRRSMPGPRLRAA